MKPIEAHKHRHSVCKWAEGPKEDWGQSFIVKGRCYAVKYFSMKTSTFIRFLSIYKPFLKTLVRFYLSGDQFKK